MYCRWLSSFWGGFPAMLGFRFSDFGHVFDDARRKSKRSYASSMDFSRRLDDFPSADNNVSTSRWLQNSGAVAVARHRLVLELWWKKEESSARNLSFFLFLWSYSIFRIHGSFFFRNVHACMYATKRRGRMSGQCMRANAIQVPKRWLEAINAAYSSSHSTWQCYDDTPIYP